MSVEILSNLQQESRRLFIAGSAMAAGDLRLTKLLPSIQKLGESSPVFKRLAGAVEELLGANREESAVKLLELSTLLSAILYTQGKTETEGEAIRVQGSGIGLKTESTYRKLHPFIEALTTKGQGRLEQIRTSFEDGSFLDLRALPAVCSALDDSYAEIPDFVQNNLIPAFGEAAVPVLRNQLNLQGGKGDGRRLLLLHQQLRSSMIELVTEAAVGGAPEIKIAAITILGEYPEQESLLLELSLERRKEVRSAAYFSLAKLGTSAAEQRLYEAAVSKDREIAVEPIQQCASSVLLSRLIVFGGEALQRYSAQEGTARTESVEQIATVIRCLEGSGSQTAQEAYSFIRTLLTTKGFLVQETENVQESAAELLLELDWEEADHFAIELSDNYKGPFIRYGFRAAFKLLSPENVYNRFVDVLGNGKSRAAKQLLMAIKELAEAQSRSEEEYEGYGAVQERQWDSRWIQQFIRLEQTELVSLFAQRPDREITDYLTAKLQAARLNDWNVLEILLTLFRIRYKDAPERFMDILEKGSVRNMYYLSWQHARLLAYMPKAYAERLRAFAEKVTYESVRNEVVAIIEAVEQKPDELNEESGRSVWRWIKSKMS
ncbi:hypothetical protein M3194_13875 [Paenibacillus glycanilyticus]|uniref:hypothetical protein n=1 Tax=Paenibacillus glycanilyticus TaxID=126569 RepID=UPI00204067B1|nr:hypothetical protein [Paenibacillus glycanilyticus]MCM3628450.1 hypothetical protein [Paenibacillus glycanilyticus]